MSLRAGRSLDLAAARGKAEARLVDPAAEDPAPRRARQVETSVTSERCRSESELTTRSVSTFKKMARAVARGMRRVYGEFP
ncbi:MULTISPECIES: hypothetical protein [Sorangium]|uniref:hypothetical protein n=1 Tax=Sorangium TaxID=39643 RepID=UPI000300B4A2|nr:hypothetical protein [Sorangium cellulosum]